MENQMVKLFHNDNYYGIDSWLIYFEKEGLYTSTDEEGLVKVLNKPTFEITNDNIDSYSTCRNFEKVFESDRNMEDIKWFNNYDTDEKKAIIKSKLDRMKTQVLSTHKHAIDRRKTVMTVYSIINKAYRAIR